MDGSPDIRPASRFADVAAILAPRKPGAQGCWCLSYRLGPAAAAELVGEARGRHVADLCARPSRAPGVLAYDGDEPIGWAGIAPTSEVRGLVQSARYPTAEGDVWTLFCFRVRAGRTRGGVARALLHGAVAYAASQGACAVDAYPVDNHGERVDRTLASFGFRALFEEAGFSLRERLDVRRGGFQVVAMRRSLV
ncbi:GNAT family N-acetyltransferase [Propionicicella superfundia]|uniref:GNAT family N-acetyltransferase n=1 Tax=Propionicicella superfundia TaxID=348582 RepID=UPI0003F68186|nr:GNAT family N-acetyltransferase [Propionicicella superfundia]